MEVEVNKFVDAGERDANGNYNYYYEGDSYTFVSGSERVVVRVYRDDFAKGSVVGASVTELNESSLASDAYMYLQECGIRTLLALGPGGGFEVWRN